MEPRPAAMSSYHQTRGMLRTSRYREVDFSETPHFEDASFRVFRGNEIHKQHLFDFIATHGNKSARVFTHELVDLKILTWPGCNLTVIYVDALWTRNLIVMIDIFNGRVEIEYKKVVKNIIKHGLSAAAADAFIELIKEILSHRDGAPLLYADPFRTVFRELLTAFNSINECGSVDIPVPDKLAGSNIGLPSVYGWALPHLIAGVPSLDGGASGNAPCVDGCGSANIPVPDKLAGSNIGLPSVYGWALPHLIAGVPSLDGKGSCLDECGSAPISTYDKRIGSNLPIVYGWTLPCKIIGMAPHLDESASVNFVLSRLNANETFQVSSARPIV